MTLGLSAYLQTIHQRRWPQSVLFTGASVNSAHQAMQTLTKALLCLHPSEQGSCGTCRACVALKQQQHVDYITIAPEQEASSIKIDAIRAMLAKVANSAQLSSTQVVCIHTCEKITIQAANALLKTLEEPKTGLYFLLHSTRPSALLPTIRSRCCTLRLPSAQVQDSKQILEDNPKLYELLWQRWPTSACLHLADSLQEYPTLEILQAMQRMVHSVLTARLAGNTDNLDALAQRFGEARLQKIPTSNLMALFDTILYHSAITHSATVATGSYQLDSLLLACTQAAKSHS